MNSLEQSCTDILMNNMEYTDQSVYFLYDTESPLARVLSDAWITVLKNTEQKLTLRIATVLTLKKMEILILLPWIFIIPRAKA